MSSHSHNPCGRAAVMLLAVASVLCSLATLAAAQDQPAPKVELYGGYSAFYPGCDLHGLLPGGVVPVSSCLTWNPRGIGASLTYNFNRWFGLTVDSSGQWGSGETGLVARIDRSEFFNLSAGPKLTFRTHYLSPFLEILVGGHRLRSEVFGSDDEFGFMAGGGLDLNLSRHFAWRLIRADFAYSNHQFGPSPLVPGTDVRGVRLQAGVVFMFGGEQPGPPVSASCAINPAEVFMGEPATATATVSSFNPKHTLNYTWSSTGGQITGKGDTASLNTNGVASGSYTVTANIVDPKAKKNGTATCSANFTIKQPQPPAVSCSVYPTTIAIGEAATVTMTASDPRGWPLTYTWSNSGGTLSGSGTSVTVTATNADAGNTITVTGTATDARANLSASCTASVNVPTAVKCATIEDWGECTFEKNPQKPWRVDNDCKDTLDKLSLRLQQMPNGKLDIVGYTNDEEVVNQQTLGAQRSVNVKYHLTTDGPNKVDASRATPRQGGTKGQATHFYFVPEGNLCAGQVEEGTVVDETAVQGQSRMAPAPKKNAHKAKPAAPPAQ